MISHTSFAAIEKLATSQTLNHQSSSSLFSNFCEISATPNVTKVWMKISDLMCDPTNTIMSLQSVQTPDFAECLFVQVFFSLIKKRTFCPDFDILKSIYFRGSSKWGFELGFFIF